MSRGLTEHQRATLDDLDTAISYYEKHEGLTEGITLSSVLESAGLEHATFSYVVKAVIEKNDPIGNERLKSIRDRLGAFGLSPRCLMDVPELPRPNSGILDGTPFQRPDKVTVIPSDSPADIAAWNTCTTALRNLPQRSREAILSSVAHFYQLGAV